MPPPRARASQEHAEPGSGAPARTVSRAAVGDLASELAGGTAPAWFGNQAIARLLASATQEVAPSADGLAAPAGLATTQRIEEYAAAVRHYAEGADGQRASDLAEFAFRFVNSQLTAIGVPRVTGGIGVSRTAGHFNPRDWSMTLDVTSFLPEAGESTPVGPLTPAQRAELAGTIYHEARHAEQTFRQARLLAGRYAEALNPSTPKVAESDSVVDLVRRAQQAIVTREETFRRLAEELAVPVEIMRAAADQPLRPIGTDPASVAFGTVLAALRGLTVADLMRPGPALGAAAAAAQARIGAHNLMVAEAERWYAERALADLVYDRAGRIRPTLEVLRAEARKAGTVAGMDLEVVRGTRTPLREVVDAIDRERDRLNDNPDRKDMHRLLGELKALVFDVGRTMRELFDLEAEPDTPARAQAIREHVELVELTVRLVDLKLQSELYEQLETERDAYEQADRVRTAWGAEPAP